MAMRSRPLLPPVLDAKPLRHRCQRLPDERVMLCGEPLESAPSHPLRLAAFTIQDAGLPPQLRPKSISPPCAASTCILAGTGVGEPMAVATGENATAVEDRHPPAAADCRANEPVTRAAQIAPRSFEAHGVLRPSIFRHHCDVGKSGSRVHARPASESTPLVRRRASTASCPGSRASVFLRAPSAAHPGCGNLPSSTSRRTASGSRYPARPLDFPVINWRTDIFMMLPNPSETLPRLRLRRFHAYSNC